jgi:ATP-binding cassette subfamily B protein
MLKLARFLKPFLVGLSLAIILLFVQAICELNLPNYMSNIVNVGIQQAGVEDVTPEALSRSGSTFITTFMDDDERALVERNFRLVSGDDEDAHGKPYRETYPKAADEQIYVRVQGLSDEARQDLDAAFGNATWTMVNLLKKIQSAEKDGTLEGLIAEQAQQASLDSGGPGGSASGTAALGIDTSGLESAVGSDSDSTDIQNLDFSKIYALQPLLDLLPPSWYSDARDQALAMDTSLRGQSGTMLVAGFYQELGVDMEGLEFDYILRIGLIMLLITVLSGVATILVGYLSSRIGAGVARNLRAAVFEKVAGFSHTEFDRFSTASLITRSTNDIAVIQILLILGIRMICYAPILGVGGVFMALSKSVSMSWTIGVAVVMLIGANLILFVVLTPKFKIMQILVDRLNLVARESLNGLTVIHAFSRVGFETQRFETANEQLTRTNLFVGRVMTIIMPITMLFMNTLTVLIIWVGAQQVADSQMQVGDMMAYMQYVMQIIMSFILVAMLFVFIPRASVSAKRINEVLATEPTIIDPTEPKHMDPARRGVVEFKNVSFRYEGAQENALCDISFTARPGQTTAFIGSTGSGKSTIVNLIPRFYDVTEGEVLVGGADVRELSQAELRGSIGYVPQKSVLVAGTIASNIAYGIDDLPVEDRQTVAEVAQALAFIEESEEGFETPIAQGGSNISGGQRQRLSIARALATKPDIYLFDDSFSALDFTTDAALRRALAEYTSEAALIIVAQRVNTIADADQIIVIDEGHIVGVGTHGELLASCDAYFEIASSQLSEHELTCARPGTDLGADPGAGLGADPGAGLSADPGADPGAGLSAGGGERHE